MHDKNTKACTFFALTNIFRKYIKFFIFLYKCTSGKLNALFTLQCQRRHVLSMWPEFAYNVHAEVH
jgi:hypothetical protein